MMQGQVGTCPGVALCRLRGMFIFCPENKISLVDIEDDGIGRSGRKAIKPATPSLAVIAGFASLCG
jgi:hypothetical protein